MKAKLCFNPERIAEGQSMGVYPENKSRTGWDKRAKNAINENLECPSLMAITMKGRAAHIMTKRE